MKCDIDDIFDFKFPNLHIKYYWENKINDTEQWNQSTCSNLFLPNPTIGQTSLRPKSLNAWKVKKIIIAKINNGGNGVKKISRLFISTPHHTRSNRYTSFHLLHFTAHTHYYAPMHSVYYTHTSIKPNAVK